ncbi:hypothetical protein Mgra_00008364 [Meloidogyne graminicola]|uniref:Lipoprotein n=1 Tax=Meloidogyne graminicola TaxID=189291 RepID=A0A8S9ZFZ9_9BILA|nr:hypothetical protein Mgra_00008364 [Meloidogyne graminicola]
MKNFKKFLFCLLPFLLLCVNCEEFRLEIFPRDYEWIVKLETNGFKIEGEKRKITKVNENQLQFNLTPEEKSKKGKNITVTINSKEKIMGRKLSQKWKLYPITYRGKYENLKNFFDFDKLHQFNFGPLEGELYFKFNLINADIINDYNIEYFVKINNYKKEKELINEEIEKKLQLNLVWKE